MSFLKAVCNRRGGWTRRTKSGATRGKLSKKKAFESLIRMHQEVEEPREISERPDAAMANVLTETRSSLVNDRNTQGLVEANYLSLVDKEGG